MRRWSRRLGTGNAMRAVEHAGGECYVRMKRHAYERCFDGVL
jgi:hypothetical protein